VKDLHILPRIRDSWSYLYLERCRIEQDDRSVAAFDARGKVKVPCASLTLLMLGPGTTITHAAVRALAENGCLVVWTGEDGMRFYAQGMGETRSALNLYHQARLWADPGSRRDVAFRLYHMRFEEPIDPSLSLAQIRGMEGLRVRAAYEKASEETGVGWRGRSYRRDRWEVADPVNRALSAANACLYGVCHAALVSAGFSPAFGFIHSGKILSFVYDVADLYKTEVTIPTAFRCVASGADTLEQRVRRACRHAFREARLLQRIVPDVEFALAMRRARASLDSAFDSDQALPGALWDPEGEIQGGVNWAQPSTEDE
jgi:CRISPR-associated protein Cas1